MLYTYVYKSKCKVAMPVIDWAYYSHSDNIVHIVIIKLQSQLSTGPNTVTVTTRPTRFSWSSSLVLVAAFLDQSLRTSHWHHFNNSLSVWGIRSQRQPICVRLQQHRTAFKSAVSAQQTITKSDVFSTRLSRALQKCRRSTTEWSSIGHTLNHTNLNDPVCYQLKSDADG